jgi:hypothetical protein
MGTWEPHDTVTFFNHSSLDPHWVIQNSFSKEFRIGIEKFFFNLVQVFENRWKLITAE